MQQQERREVTMDDRHKMAELILKGRKNPNAWESRQDYFTHFDGGVYGVCALGLVTIGSCGGNIEEAYEVFYAGGKYSDDLKYDLHGRIARRHNVPESLVRQIDQAHHAGMTAAHIAEKLLAGEPIAN